MSMKMMKKAMIGLAGAAALSAASTASADVYYSVDGGSAQLLTTTPVGAFSFQSAPGVPVELTRNTIIGPITVNCEDVRLDGTVELVPGTPDRVRVEVANGGIGDTSGLCGDIELDFSSPWYAEIDESDLGTSASDGTVIPGVFNDVVVRTPPFGSACASTSNDNINVTYSNVGADPTPSEFDFDSSLGDCEIDGTVLGGANSTSNVKIWSQ
jgi:hypothetical protein